MLQYRGSSCQVNAALTKSLSEEVALVSPSGEDGSKAAPGVGALVVFELALGLGLLTGLTEAALWVLRDLWTQGRLELSLKILWMAPLADCVSFAAVGLVLSILRMCWPRLITLPRAICILAFMSLGALLLMAPRLHWAAALLLAAGLAVQSARWVAKYPGLVRKFIGPRLHVRTGETPCKGKNNSDGELLQETGPLLTRRRVLIASGATVAGLTVGVKAWEQWRDGRARATTPFFGSQAAINVLFIVLDTVRAQNMGLYGYGRDTTPKLRRLASRGVSFSRVFHSFVDSSIPCKHVHGALPSRIVRRLGYRPGRHVPNLGGSFQVARV